MSHCSYIKYTSHRLFFLDQECSICLLSHAVVNHIGFQGVGAWLLMFNLHPDWTQLINFTGITQSDLFDWSLSIFSSWSYGHPALGLRNNLHHFLWSTIWILMLHILVVGVVKNSHEIWSDLVILWLQALVNGLAPDRGLMPLEDSLNIFGSIHISLVQNILSLVTQVQLQWLCAMGSLRVVQGLSFVGSELRISATFFYLKFLGLSR